MRKFIFALLLSLSVSSYANVQVEVLDVMDGDTLRVRNLKNDEIHRVRLAGVDTPETGFQNKSQGEPALRAKSYLISLLPPNGIVTLTNESQTDPHGRILGVIEVNGKILNEEILKAGWGLPYDIDNTNQERLLQYAEACLEAEENQRGLFSPEHVNEFEEPYNFRMRVQKKLGRNIVGNILTRELFHTLDIKQVPVCLRVFYSNELLAKSQGYK